MDHRTIKNVESSCVPAQLTSYRDRLSFARFRFDVRTRALFSRVFLVCFDSCSQDGSIPHASTAFGPTVPALITATYAGSAIRTITKYLMIIDKDQQCGAGAFLASSSASRRCTLQVDAAKLPSSTNGISHRPYLLSPQPKEAHDMQWHDPREPNQWRPTSLCNDSRAVWANQ